MNTLLRLLDHVTAEEASRIISEILNEDIKEYDIFNLASFKKITLSIIFHDVEYLKTHRIYYNLSEDSSRDTANDFLLDLVQAENDIYICDGLWDISPDVNFHDLFCHSKRTERFEYEEGEVELILSQNGNYITDEEDRTDKDYKPSNSADYSILNRHPVYEIVVKKEFIDSFIQSFLAEKSRYDYLDINKLTIQPSVSDNDVSDKRQVSLSELQEKINSLQKENALLVTDIQELGSTNLTVSHLKEPASLGLVKERNLNKTIGSLATALLHYGPANIRKPDGSLNINALAKLLEGDFPPKNINGFSSRTISDRLKSGLKDM